MSIGVLPEIPSRTVLKFRLAGKYGGLVSESVPQTSYAFFSTSFLDDLAYAAAWLHKATGDQT